MPPDAWHAFLRGAGLVPDQVRGTPATVLASAGAMLRQMIAGLVLMVDARARTKAQLGLQATSLELEGNNPLKFIRAPERALLQLLEPPERGFMDAARAVEDAHQDLQAHQMATLGAMRGALAETLARFSPAAIRERQETRGWLSRLLPGAREAALWQAYEREFEGAVRGADEAFMDMFAKEFRVAYERHIAEMKARRRD
jgi:type VI secretion system protein ImpI/type VI secretion system protein